LKAAAAIEGVQAGAFAPWLWHLSILPLSVASQRCGTINRWQITQEQESVMQLQDLVLLTALPENSEAAQEGLGFNGNILETNIVNLSVVIGIVVSFGGDALRSLLENRRQRILATLEQANQRAQEAKQRLEEATSQLEFAQKRAEEIRQQGKAAAGKERSSLLARTEEDVLRLETAKDETLALQQQRAVAQVSQRAIQLALGRVRDKLASRLDPTFHQSVNSFNIVLFTNYKPG
jgi:F-type H+-transporting ATPase subunit b